MPDIPPVLQSKTKKPAKSSLVVFAIIGCVLVFVIFSAAAALWAAQALAYRIRCVNNMKFLGLAMRIYSSDNDDRFPSTNWCDVILTNGIRTPDYMTNLSEIFRCPAAPKNQKSSYAMNRQLVGLKDTVGIAPDTVMLFESDAGWNAVGGPEILAQRHHSGLDVTLADGSVLQIEGKDIPKLRWNPYTNAPTK